jgi:4-hydroxy-tetrahydrodipicolinate synthase
MFHGTYTALVTPFRNDQVDYPAFDRLIEQQIAGGVDGIVPVGTTGESPTLDHAEHIGVIARAVQVARGRVKVMAGTGSNSTSEAIDLTLEAQKAGADGALLVAPYYNKPTQSGLLAHFQAIAKASSLPLVLYSIPGRCGIEIGVETTAILAKNCPTIVGIKEAGGNADRVSQLRQVVPENFTILSGDDSLTLSFMALGAVGVISVASNVVPAVVSSLVQTFAAGKRAEAEKIHRRYYPLFRDLFIESNPVPVKFALARQGWMTEDVRLPLVPLSTASRNKLIPLLEDLGL